MHASEAHLLYAGGMQGTRQVVLTKCGKVSGCADIFRRPFQPDYHREALGHYVHAPT